MFGSSCDCFRSAALDVLYHLKSFVLIDLAAARLVVSYQRAGARPVSNQQLSPLVTLCDKETFCSGEFIISRRQLFHIVAAFSYNRDRTSHAV